ncbi:MAG: winged helix-turn-helix transcriptional regulator, partial [Streptosporangiaceae bacterium]
MTGKPSSIGRALLVLGDQWTLLILQRAFLGVRRFQDWQVALNVSESVLASRLRDLLTQGLLTKVRYAGEGVRGREEYRLTASGLATWRILVAIWNWENRWVTSHTGLPDLRHERCGRTAEPVLACGHCGLAVTPHETAVEQRHGTYDEASPPRRHRHRGKGPDPRDPLSFFPETLELLGDRWGSALLAASFLGLSRFGEFERELRIPPSVLSERLRRFTELGVLRAEDRTYRLTDKGL